MLVHQYAYFALSSNQVSAAEITARLLIDPDEVVTRGSRHVEPVRPASHSWKIVCRKPGLTVEEQIASIVDRLFAYAPMIGDVATELDRIDGMPGAATMQVVRVFEHPAPKAEELSRPVDVPAEPLEQPSLLGWRLNARTLTFLQLTHAELDVDEYGY
ncbi:DUF4279 domain-containing protein [Actinoplanes sp. DH11]|uniref:DUF4279 domain-containing protein n=1 Tax=Actinoplanes sp. DH11 TaxID=2857011 RepID=UPI001E4DB91F|nr:DUF4279 domain-containing protein [Actinoplanes sp. DH11]